MIHGFKVAGLAVDFCIWNDIGWPSNPLDLAPSSWTKIKSVTWAIASSPNFRSQLTETTFADKHPHEQVRQNQGPQDEPDAFPRRGGQDERQ